MASLPEKASTPARSLCGGRASRTHPVLRQRRRSPSPLSTPSHGRRRRLLTRSTLCGWVQGSVELLRHLVDAMWEDAKISPVAIADATGVLVQARDECKRCHFYVVVTPKQHVLFRFTKKNDGDRVAALLAGFRRLHVDASAVYHELFRRDPSLFEVGCWAHARRKFFEALSADRDAAMFGIGMIGLLYDAHNAARGSDGVVDPQKRAKAARPILARLLAWARIERRTRSDGDPMKTAVGYLVRQRRVLTRFLGDGSLRLDTNPAELELRREVAGRKNPSGGSMRRHETTLSLQRRPLAVIEPGEAIWHEAKEHRSGVAVATSRGRDAGIVSKTEPGEASVQVISAVWTSRPQHR